MIFITGGTGLVGAHLLYELIVQDKKVMALKRTSSDLTSVNTIFTYYSPENGQKLFDQIKWVDGDITDIDSIDPYIKQCNEIYHAAAHVSFKKKDFQKLLDINKNGTANIVNCALSNEINKLGFVSSTAAIGDAKKGCANENDLWKSDPELSNYSVSKYMAEMEVWRGQTEGLNVSIVNPSLILGPGDIDKSSTRLFSVIRKGLKYYPSGANAFVDVRDVSSVLIKMMDQNVFGERVLAVGENEKFKVVFDKMAKAQNVRPPYKSLPIWLAGLAWRLEGVRSKITNSEPRITKESTRSAFDNQCYDNQKAKDLTNHEFYSIDSAIKNAVAYFDKVSD